MLPYLQSQVMSFTVETHSSFIDFLAGGWNTCVLARSTQAQKCHWSLSYFVDVRRRP